MVRIVVLCACVVALPGGAQELEPTAFDRDVPVSLAAEEAWSWFGLPEGGQEAWGVAYELPAARDSTVHATASPVQLAAPAALAYALISPVVEGQLASVSFERSEAEALTVKAEDCALAWAADKPRTRRLLLARGEAEGGASITRIVPSGCYLFAIVVGGGDAAADGELKSQYERGQAEWRERFFAEAPGIYRLRDVAAGVPSGRIAVLPPRGGEPAALSMVLGRTGLKPKLVELEGKDLLKPELFNAERFPLALYVGAERHLRTIREPNDAAEAVIRYVSEGGIIVMATSLPYPTYYAIDAGKPKPEPNQPLLRRLGIDIVAAFERPPEGSKLSLHPIEGQTVLSLQESWPYPETGDLRLRCFDVKGDVGAMTTIVEVRNADGTPVGPCAALFDLGESGGAILYVWSGIMNDARIADEVACDIVRWIAKKLDGVRDAE